MTSKYNSNTTGVKSFQSEASISPWIYKRNGCGVSTSEITTITVTPVYIPSTLTVVGSVTADSFISPSDKILKENITPITEQKAKQLLSLTPVEYNLKMQSEIKQGKSL